MSKSVNDKIKPVNSVIQFQKRDGINSLSIAGNTDLADLSIDDKNNVVLTLNSDESKLNSLVTDTPNKIEIVKADNSTAINFIGEEIGEVNTIETISVNDENIQPVDKNVDITIPTKISELENDTITANSINAIPKAEKGVANGVATLNGNGIVPLSQLPEFETETPSIIEIKSTGSNITINSLGGASETKIDTISVNNENIEPIEKNVDITIPTKTSDLVNDSITAVSLGAITDITANTETIIVERDENNAIKLDITGVGEENIIESISANGTDINPVDKNVDITIPTRTSDLINDSITANSLGAITDIDTATTDSINVIAKTNGYTINFVGSTGSTYRFIYECTGTNDATALNDLISNCFASGNKTYSIKVTGNFGLNYTSSSVLLLNNTANNNCKVTLDFTDCYIPDFGNYYFAYISNYSNVDIIGLNLKNTDVAIYCLGTGEINIRDSYISCTTGIINQSSATVNINNLTIVSSGYGINNLGSGFVNANNIKITANSNIIYCHGSSTTNINNCNFTGAYGVWVEDTANCKINNFSITSTSSNGLYALGTSKVYMSNGNLTGQTAPVYLSGSLTLRMSACDINCTGTDQGFYANGSDITINLFGCNIAGNSGAYMTGDIKAKFIDCVIRGNNGIGATCYTESKVYFTDCDIYGYTTGITAYASTVVLSGGYIQSNTLYGMQLSGTSARWAEISVNGTKIYCYSSYPFYASNYIMANITNAYLNGGVTTYSFYYAGTVSTNYLLLNMGYITVNASSVMYLNGTAVSTSASISYAYAFYTANSAKYTTHIQPNY